MVAARGIEARRELRIGLELAFEKGKKPELCRLFGRMAIWCERNYRQEMGVWLLASAERMLAQTGRARDADEQRDIDVCREKLQRALGSERFDVAWDAGTNLTLAQVMQLVRE